MNKIIKKTLKIVLPVLLGGFILYWVYRDFDFERAKELLLHGTDWGWMLFSLFFGRNEPCVSRVALATNAGTVGGLS